MSDIKKFLDYEGVQHLWSKINMNDYPNNEMLMAVINAIDETKVDKIDGKGLSTNDFTNEYKEKLNNIDLTNYATKIYVDNSKVAIDTTLQVQGQAADAKAVGEAIKQIASDEIYILDDGETIDDAPKSAVMVINPDGYIDNPNSGGSVNKDGLTLGIHSDGLVYVFVDGVPVGNGIEMATNGDVFGYVDENGNIIVQGNLPDGTYSVKYEIEDGSTIDIGDLVLDTNIYYSVTNTLTNCVTSNSATEAIGGQSYSATITANSGYELSSVTVTMGGNPVTVTGGTVTIANVTGNIVITAEAEEVSAQPSYINLLPLMTNADDTAFVGTNGEKGYKYGFRIKGSTGAEEACDNVYCSGYTEAGYRDLIRVKNVTLHETVNYNQFVFYDSSYTKVYAVTFSHANVESDGAYSIGCNHLTDINTMAYVRICCGVISDNTIITKNEEIV